MLPTEDTVEGLDDDVIGVVACGDVGFSSGYLCCSLVWYDAAGFARGWY